MPRITERPYQHRISRSLGESTMDWIRLTASIIRNLERLIEQFDFHQGNTSLLILILEYRDGGRCARKVQFPEPTASFELFSAPCVEILGRWRGGDLVNGMHIDAERLTKGARAQLGLFSRGRLPKAGRAMPRLHVRRDRKAVDSIFDAKRRRAPSAIGGRPEQQADQVT